MRIQRYNINFIVLEFLILLFLIGCSLVPVPQVSREVSPQDANQAWAEVLKTYVDDQGRVDFKSLSKKPGPLHNYVYYISKNGPTSHPELFKTHSLRLAYYINSFNALSMYNILESEIPESLSGFKKVSFFYFKKFIIDGEKTSLYSYEKDVIRKQKEERVHFALNCMSRGCPRLPQKPFTAENLEKELDFQAKYFFSENRNIYLDPKNKKVFISEILDFYTEDFLVKTPSLIAYVNQYRKPEQKIPQDYKVDFIPYDWEVNSQKPRVTSLEKSAP